MDQALPETLAHIALFLADGSIDGVRMLLTLASVNHNVRDVVLVNTVWRHHFLAMFDVPDSTDLYSDPFGLLKSRWLNLRANNLETLHTLVAEHHKRNMTHLERVDECLLQPEVFFETMYVHSSRIEFLLRVLVHCVVANYHRKQEMAAPMLELFYEVGSMLGSQARNDILDEDFKFVPPGTVSDQRPIKVYFLQAVLMVLLPLETAPDGAPNKVLFDSPKLSLREWNQLQVDDPHKFWKHLIPGKWTGFYADYRIGLDRAEFNELFPICDGPMRDLVLDWTTETKEAFVTDSEEVNLHEFPSTLYFTGEGKDDVNEFSVTGRIDVANRNVLFSKEYATFGWQYKGTLNEFGIAGVWETNSPHYVDVKLSTEYINQLIQTSNSGIIVVSFSAIPTGWNNRAIKVTTSANEVYLLRLSSAKSWPRSKIENEVASLKFITKEIPTLRTPSILSFGFDFHTEENPNKVHWLLMEFIDGDMLEGVWRSLSTTNKMAILDEIRENVKALQSKTFTSIGGWKLADNETPVLGEYWSGNSFYESEVDFLIKELDANLKSVKSMESSSSDLKDAIEGIAALRYDILCALQALTPAPVVLFHGDFAFRNIIVKKDIETDQFSLAAILDWEWCGTRPLWLDWIGDWLEEDTAEDELENKWIRSEMKRDGFPIFENLDGFKLRSVVYDLTDSIAAWRLEGDDISRAVKRIGRILEEAKDILKGQQ